MGPELLMKWFVCDVTTVAVWLISAVISPGLPQALVLGDGEYTQ